MKDNSCLMCKFFNRKKWGTCKAFPDGIPFEINSGEFAHDKIYPGQDNDIVFEKIED